MFVGASTWLPPAADIKASLSSQRPVSEPHDLVAETMAAARSVLFSEPQKGVLEAIGFDVEWRCYAGAEQEGHWLKVPEVDHIRKFVAGTIIKGDDGH